MKFNGSAMFWIGPAVFLLFIVSSSSAKEMPGKANRNKVVGLDNYYNHEFLTESGQAPQPFHYIWQDTRMSGFSGLAAIIQGLGARIAKVEQAPDEAALKKLSIYIIVDPDTPKETQQPNYIGEKEIRIIADWVKNGGVLVLLGNDKNNCEFEHLNKLAETFGIHFNDDLRNTVANDDFAMARFSSLPVHPLFTSVSQIYIKELCTLKLQPPAKPVFQDGADVIMAMSEFGKVKVFAVGDPWFYNEYLDGYKLPPEYENTKAAGNLFLWLLAMSNEPQTCTTR
jgi:unsaturated rhamnogalacturonyl hydrolase